MCRECLEACLIAVVSFAGFGPMKSDLPEDDETGRLPLFGSWRNAYLVIVLIFILEVGFFYLVSGYFE